MTRIAAWTQRPYFSFDIESTGVDPLSQHAATATLVKIVDGAYSDKREWTLRPAVPMPAEATAIHGITDEFLTEHGEDPATALEAIAATLAQVLNAHIPLVVYNAAYDLTLMETQCELYHLPSLRSRVVGNGWDYVIDPFVLVRGFESFWKQEFVKGRNNKLPSVCERYGVPFVESHDATADAIGAGLLAAALVNQDDVMSTKGPHALAELHRSWRVRSQDSLRKYFDKNNIEHDGVDAGWPMHSSLMPS